MPSSRTFRSWNSYFEFEWDVQRRRRYWHSSATRRFLQTVVATSAARTHEIPIGTELYRSQLGGRRPRDARAGLVVEGSVEGPHAPERMKPLFDRASEGRANPRGIPYLYLADDPDTAIAELRPWPGQYLTLSVFCATRAIRVVDCSTDRHVPYLKEPAPALREISVWGAINEAFARPLSPDDTSADYAPTQTLAEVFRESGFEGIIYRSSCGPSHNVVLFNLLLADAIRCTLCQVQTVQYGWTWTGAIENHAP